MIGKKEKKMDNITKYLNKISYKFPKGYPNINNPEEKAEYYRNYRKQNKEKCKKYQQKYRDTTYKEYTYKKRLEKKIIYTEELIEEMKFQVRKMKSDLKKMEKANMKQCLANTKIKN